MAVAMGGVSRFAGIDLLKAAGIVAVVWIHAFLKWGTPHPEAIERVGYLTRFAVPGFLFAAGFLQAAGSRMGPRELVTKRLTRILLPGWSPISVTLQYVMIYGIVLGVVFWWWHAPDRPWLRWLSEATYPIYLYHYFVIVLMERMPASLAWDAASFVAAAAASVLLVGVAKRLIGRPARLVLP
jgi:peptidoglycan/LPS O-acetylase OafA/YrhL